MRISSRKFKERVLLNPDKKRLRKKNIYAINHSIGVMKDY